MILPILISVSVAPVSYFFWASAPPFATLLFLVIFLVPHGARQIAVAAQQLLGKFKKN